MSMNRPDTCIDKQCGFIYSSFDKDRNDIEKGFSYFCYGKLPGNHIGADFKHIDAQHDNDISHCIYTPLKGIIRFFVNKDDLWIELLGMMMTLDKLHPIGKCVKCGEEIKRFNELTFSVCPIEGGIHCKPCYHGYEK
jgi:hypothetical protein